MTDTPINSASLVAGGAIVGSGNPLPVQIVGGLTYTWSTKPASPTTGLPVFLSDVGTKGSFWFYDGTRWKPLNNQAMLASLDTASSSINASETIVLQYQMQAAFWQLGDRIRLMGELIKSGTTNTGTVNIRIGTAGTTSDTAVMNATELTAGNRAIGMIFDVRLESATSVQLLQNGVGGYIAPNSSTIAAATTISNVSSSLFFSVSIQGGATDSVQLYDGHLTLISKAN